MQGYLGNLEATEDAIDSGGWLKTGDVGYKQHGKFYIVDRRKVSFGQITHAKKAYFDSN